jgi:hypothetical protein
MFVPTQFNINQNTFKTLWFYFHVQMGDIKSMCTNPRYPYLTQYCLLYIIVFGTPNIIYVLWHIFIRLKWTDILHLLQPTSKVIIKNLVYVCPTCKLDNANVVHIYIEPMQFNITLVLFQIHLSFSMLSFILCFWIYLKFCTIQWKKLRNHRITNWIRLWVSDSVATVCLEQELHK